MRKAILSLSMIAALATVPTAWASDQYGHSQKQEKRDLKAHQRQERAFNGNSHALRDHEKGEKRQLKRHQRAERQSYGSPQYGGAQGYPSSHNGYPDNVYGSNSGSAHQRHDQIDHGNGYGLNNINGYHNGQQQHSTRSHHDDHHDDDHHDVHHDDDHHD